MIYFSIAINGLWKGGNSQGNLVGLEGKAPGFCFQICQYLDRKIFSILNFRKPQGKAADDYIPDVPDENAAAGVLPTEIRKLIEARKEVKKLLNNPNLTDDNLR